MFRFFGGFRRWECWMAYWWDRGRICSEIYGTCEAGSDRRRETQERVILVVLTKRGSSCETVSAGNLFCLYSVTQF
ncbi:hypothetical protein DsansV1_C17g0143571 [Dioscorea sansibarensis]